MGAKKVFILSVITLFAIGVLYFVVQPKNDENEELYKEMLNIIQNADQISQMSMSEILSGEITDDTLYEVYICLCEKCDYGYSLKNCNDVEKNYWLVYNFNGEVSNGGVEQFIYNCYEVKGDTLTALADLNLHSSYQYLSEALSLYPEHLIDMDTNQELSKQLESLDEQYYLLHDEEFYNWAVHYLEDYREYLSQ